MTRPRPHDSVPQDSVLHEDATQELVTGEAVALDLRATGFVLRAAGAIIDFLVYFGGYILLSFIFSVLAGQLGLDAALTATFAVVGGVLCLVVIPTVVETLSQGKSLGKLAVGARVVRDDGGSIGLRHALIRSLVGVIELYMTFGALAAATALLNGKAKRLGDLVAGTYSQNERVGALTPPVYGVPVQLMAWSTTADVARMPDALARRVTQFLASAAGFSPSTRERFSASLANEVSAYVSPVPTVNPELFLAAVNAVRRDREYTALTLEQAQLQRLAPALTGMPRGFPDRG